MKYFLIQYNLLEPTTFTTISNTELWRCRVLEGALQCMELWNCRVLGALQCIGLGGYNALQCITMQGIGGCNAVLHSAPARLVSDSQRIFFSITPATAYQDICLPYTTSLQCTAPFYRYIFFASRPQHTYLHRCQL